MGEDVFDSGGSESGVVEDTAEDERAVMLVEAADMFVDATDEVLLDGDGDGFLLLRPDPDLHPRQG